MNTPAAARPPMMIGRSWGCVSPRTPRPTSRKCRLFIEPARALCAIRWGSHYSLQQLGILQQREELLAQGGEFRPILLGNRIRGRQAEPFEILVLPVVQNAEVEMRARGQAGAAYKTNHLSHGDALASMHKHAGQMQIHRLVTVGVGDLDDVALAPFARGDDNATRADGLNGRPDGSAIVGAQMGAVDLQNRVEPRVAEMRGDRGSELQGRP